MKTFGRVLNAGIFAMGAYYQKEMDRLMVNTDVRFILGLRGTLLKNAI